MSIETKMEQLAKLVHDFKKSNDEELNAIKTRGNADPLLKEQTDKMNERISQLDVEIKKMQTAMQRPSTEEGKETKVDPEHKANLDKYFRKGVEFKALTVDSDPNGGYLVTPEMSSEIVKFIYESSPMRQLASVQSISSDSLEMIADLDEVSSGWVGETESRSETDTPELKKLVFPVHELYAKPKASQKMLDDAFVNIEQWLAEHVSAKFARDEATAFITGSGFAKPKGIMSYTAGTSFNEVEQVVSGSAAAITADGMIDVAYALKEEYRKNAKWLMNRATVKAARKLKDSQNQYLWGPGLNGSSPSQLLGFDVFEAADVAVQAANALVAAFGDFKAGYQIVDRFGIRVLRDPYSSKPYIEFYTTKRVGGGVKNFDAIKILKCST